MRSSSRILTVAAIGIMITSCGLKKEKTTVIQPVKVDVVAVCDSSQSVARQYSGTVESGEGADMSFTVSGTLKGIYVEPGQKVTKGQLLAEIDAASLQNANQVAEATLAQAQDAYSRLKKLHDANALPDIQWVEVQSKLRQAENAAAIARRAVGDARIYSPINGVVSEKLAEVGQTVAPAIPVVKIVSLNDIKVSISVPEAEIRGMRPGTKASVTAQAVESGHIEGILTEQGVMANPLSRTYDVKFKVPNPDGILRPGMLCNVTVETPAATTETAAKIIIPSAAVLLSADNRHFVWLARNGEARQQFITPGAIMPEGVEIESGLTSGDSLIVAGMQKVCNGTKIQY